MNIKYHPPSVTNSNREHSISLSSPFEPLNTQEPIAPREQGRVMVPGTDDNSRNSFHPCPLNLANSLDPDLLSQEVFQSTPREQGADMLQPPMSTAHTLLPGTDSLSVLPEANTDLSASLQSSNCTPLSSMYSSDPDLNSALDTLLNVGKSNPSVDDDINVLSFLLLIPFPLSTDLQSQEMSQSAPKEQGVDVLQLPTSTASLHLPGSDSVCPPPPPDTGAGLSASLQCSNSAPPSNDELSFLFPLCCPLGTDFQSLGMSQSTPKEQGRDMVQLPISNAPLHFPGSRSDSSVSPSPHFNNSASPFSTFSSDSVNHVQVLNDERVEMGMSEMGDYGVDHPLPLCTDLLSQRMSHSKEKERGMQIEKSNTEKRVTSEVGVCTSTDFPVLSSLPTDLPGQSGHCHSSLPMQSYRAHSPKSSYPSQPEDDAQCTHFNPDPHYTMTGPLTIQPASQKTMAGVPSPNLLTAVSCSSQTSPQLCSETPSQMKANFTVKTRNRFNEKQGLIKTARKERKRKLNRISGFHYRQKKKEEQSILEERREQLEATNLRLKEQASALIAEIAELKQKTQKKKNCSFLLFSTATSE